MTIFRCVSTAALTILLATAALAADKKVQLKDLPATVQKAVQVETKDSTIVGYAEEREHGKVFYEVETKVGGMTRDLLFDATGALVAVEEEVALDTLPPAVTKAFNASGKVLKAESITEGSTVTYEARVQGKNGKTSEVVVDAAGQPVKP